MSDFAISDARKSRSTGACRFPVFGAAGGNVGFAVQATRTAQRRGASRIGERSKPLLVNLQ